MFIIRILFEKQKHQQTIVGNCTNTQYVYTLPFSTEPEM